ncbi:phosphoribosylformylglycinamidine synthase subunit PurL [bacterium]|nr:phosphoribosylformylglycinamidine synthase subunit PurL [bacterium]
MAQDTENPKATTGAAPEAGAQAGRLPDTYIPDPPGPELLAKVGLTQAEYDNIVTILRRKPNLVELGIFGAMWSEHCSYKTSRRHLKKFPVTGKYVLQGPGENAGVMDLGGDYAVVFKIESHNHPSAVEPFQGAATGVGGIIRDIFAMGARPIALLNSLRFGNLTELAPVGGEEEHSEAPEEAGADAPAEAGAEEETPAGGQIDWNAAPAPYVVVVNWMTNARRPIFERQNVARQAVEVIRQIHDDAHSGMGGAEVLGYCVVPDSILLALRVHSAEGVNKEEADAAVAEVVAVIKAQLAPVAAEVLRRGEQLFETGYRSQRKFDSRELAEAIKRIEFTPVQRALVQQVKDWPFVSSVWRFGVCWPDSVPATRRVEKAGPLPYSPGVTAEQAARNRFLLGGVVSGIAHYGNCIGIPTVGGEVVFDPSYSGNPLVNAMCVGIVHKKNIIKAIADGPGNHALIVGAKTGRDGVQGATFASVELAADSGKDRPAVQVGDPFMEKLLLEATLEIQKLPGLVGVQDFGAAGLTCSSVEMAARAGTGMRLDLDAVPQRASDLSAYEMMLSESQERMMVVVDRGLEEPFLEVFRKWGLTAVPCGQVLDIGRLIVIHEGEEVAKLPNAPLAEGAPDYDRPFEAPAWYRDRKPATDGDIAAALQRILGGQEDAQEDAQEGGQEGGQEAGDVFGPLLRRLLEHPSIASKYPVYQQYDYLVRANTVQGPGLTDAAVVRVKETGQGLAVSCDGPGRHAYLDPRLGGARAVLESARNVLAVGARPLGITNNLNFGNPEKPDRMWQLVEAIEGMAEACRELETPVTGGNVSLYNESRLPGSEGTLAILPTPTVGMVGVLDKYQNLIRNCTEREGLELFVLGSTDGRLDGSLLLFDLGRLRAGELGAHNYVEFRACDRFLSSAGSEGAIVACHDISDGGLAVALTELCLSGCNVDVAPQSGGAFGVSGRSGRLTQDRYDSEEHNLLAALFGEEGHRWLVAVPAEKKGWLRTAAMHYSAPLIPLGRSGGGRIVIRSGEQTLIDAPAGELQSLHREGLAKLLA